MRELLSEKTAFVIDDTAFMRTGLIKQLVELGFNKEKILQFENGKAALDAILKSQVDIVFSDWNMPILDGVSFLKHLRSSDSEMKDVPVIMVTTESERSRVVEALHYRLSGYILKPVHQQKLKDLLFEIFGETNE